MKTPRIKRRSNSVAPADADSVDRAATAAPEGDPPKILASVARRVTGAMRIARSGARVLVERVPATVHATQAGARETTSALQRLPDSTLRWLAASSVGLGTGFYLTGAPRPIIAAGVAPALIMGAAIALRPRAPKR
jgi:hypothetical protein